MTLSSFPSIYHEMYACHMIFRNLGFQSNELFVSVSDVVDVGEHVFCLRLQAQNKTFTLPVAPVPRDVSRQEVFRRWSAFVEAIQAPGVTDEELAASQRQTVIQNPALQLELILALRRKGFNLPEQPNPSSLKH